MSIERDADIIEWTCDICGDTQEVEGAHGKQGFHDAWNELREAGWRAFHVEGVWRHKCPECMNTFGG